MFVQHACGLTITADTICVMLKQAFGLYHIQWSIDRRFWGGGSGNMKIPFQKKKWWGFNARKPFPHNLLILSRQFYCQQISGLDHDKIEVVVVSFVRTTKMVSSPWSDDSI